MAIKDVLRDTGVPVENYLLVAQLYEQEYTICSAMTSEKLWELHAQYSLHSPKGQAVLQLLKEREPEKFRKE